MAQTNGVEVLLVEDDPQDVELILLALDREGLQKGIHVVRDGAEALQFIFGDERACPLLAGLKVVLLDLKLPRVSGFEVLRQIRADARVRACPVVILTSSGEASDIARSYALGANSYLVKPVNFDAFLNCVAQMGRYWLTRNEPPRLA